MNKKLVLVDGHSIMNRAFYGLPEMTTAKGEHTNGVLGFLNIFLRLLETSNASHVIVAFDVKQPTFRHIRYEAYKGTRKPMPPELHEQIPYIKEMLRAMGVGVVEHPGLEADDILGTLSVMGEKEGYDVTILSGDRDLLQLATKKVCIRIPKTKAGGTIVEEYFDKDVEREYELTPTEFIDLKGLMGDTADNIPGVPGIGPKTGIKILKEFHSLEQAYEHIQEIMPKKAKENMIAFKDQAFLSKELATIKTDAELGIEIEQYRIKDLFTKEAFELVKRFEMKSLRKYFETEEVNAELQVEYELTSDMVLCDSIFAQCKNAKVVGVSIIGEQVLLGISVSYQGKNYVVEPGGFLLQEYLVDKVLDLFANAKGIISMIDVKREYKLIPRFVPESEHVFDISLAAYLLNPLRQGYDAEEVGEEYGITMQRFKELFPKKKWNEVYEEEKPRLLEYEVKKTVIAEQLYEKLKNDLMREKMLSLYQEIELPTMYVLYSMEMEGIGVNREALKEYGEQLVDRIKELEQWIYQEVGHEFNISSPKQLGVVLFEELSLPKGKKTKTGYSTSAEILEELQGEFPIVSNVLEYRQLTKLKSTYADGLANYIGKDERIHGTFNQTVTATGRISSTEPNLQNIPMKLPLGRSIRKVFIPKENYVFVDADYSQIELRVLAELSGDETLAKAYQEGQDIHALTASKVFHVPLEEVTSLERRNAKAVNFGIVYGISAFGLSKDLRIGQKQAKEYIEEYFETYPKIKIFLDETVAKAKKDGRVTTMFGRIRPIPELASSNFMQRSFGERVAMNSPIQGTAADIIKIAMVRVNRRLLKEQLQSKLILQIHDELLVETHESEVAFVKQILKEEMEGAVSTTVPMLVEAMEGADWYEAK